MVLSQSRHERGGAHISANREPQVRQHTTLAGLLRGAPVQMIGAVISGAPSDFSRQSPDVVKGFTEVLGVPPQTFLLS